MKRALQLIGLGLCVATAASAQQAATPGADVASTAPDMGFHSPAGIDWQPGPPSLPAGASFAVLEGNPAQEGPFVMRLKMPDGYRIPPHWHPKVERVTVLSGSFNLGMGETFDQAATREMLPGTFGFWPPGMRHFAWARGETVLQLHGVGPWQITYVDPADDPRNATEPGR
jgi:quercetin dioxygenase-like cupin family protein